ncbi:MAG: chorismate synthase [Clostridiales bacterium]|nr:chorismate synthase [Clostridiales bacterium]
MLRYFTAGESHGKCLTGIIEGFPSNVPIDIEIINADLQRRQRGYGRGHRMAIEEDKLEILSGIRNGKTLGSPIAFSIQNRDYKNWVKYMDPVKIEDDSKGVTKPRPGHADLSGAIKYNFTDIRNVLERSSARETAVRVAIGSMAKQLLRHFDIDVISHVTTIGSASLKNNIYDIESIRNAENSPVRCVDSGIENQMINIIEETKKTGDSLGGIFEIHITGVPIGLGSYVHWDRKLDAKLAYSLMSIQAIKAVEIGEGVNSGRLKGSQVHDEIFYDSKKGYYRQTNRAGGIEGGMSNGENIIIRCTMKPIPTLYKPLKSVDIETKESFVAAIERSDTCAVPAASIVGEMVAITVIADEFLRKYGSDDFEEIIRRWKK